MPAGLACLILYKAMGKALYRKYRSKKLSEIVGQEHITTAIDHALQSGRISHAYLFTGPRGTGKTSIARILAHEINGLDYADESTHLDIIEIDAASNRRIDEIRDLRDKVHIAPSSAKYKVYIIDEVHMLTKEAFNALLKTLEEPPAHVVFILATTEVHKLPDTIISRTQRFTFKPVDRKAVIKHLKSIAKEEGIKVNDEALGLLADHGGGSFRDSISLLDMAGNTSEEVTVDTIRQMLGIAPQEAIEALLQACANGSPQDVHAQLQKLREQGITAVHVAKQLGQTMREQLLAGTTKIPGPIVLKTLEDLLAVPSSLEPETELEIVLYGCVLALGDPDQLAPKVAKQPHHASAHSDAPAAPTVTARPAEVKPPKVDKPKPAEPVATVTAEPPKGELIQDVIEAWPKALIEIRSTQNTLYGILRQAHSAWNGTHLVLTFRFAFHQRRVNDARTRRVIIDTMQTVSGQTITIECLVDENVEASPAMPLPAPDVSSIEEDQATVASEASAQVAPSQNNLDSVANVFGGVEVLES